MTQTQLDFGGGVRDEAVAYEDKSKNHLGTAVDLTCKRLQRGYFSDPNSQSHRSARAALAEMRRYASLDLANNPLALGNVLFVMGEDFSEKLEGKGDEPSPSEYAAYVALTLFAVHMQSASEPVHVTNVSFAQACGTLNSISASKSIKPRIDAMLLANSESARLVHIRSLVTLMRSNDLGFDYGRLASDLRSLANPKKRAGIQLRWGREFARGTYSASKDTEEPEN
ncbi:CRISPR system Cascade subunit CasB [Trueperella bonasi]|uniref:CRISPR system Cascade subunit CasB n=1 Tax=Trueperella bonasi TaxID=312286 RepID=A0ABT9NET3_9ACTO|nr:type I-E CRISPR-associated protein Cse2/CasB [Trueperella bonasi]MDP9805891.1 CRISPR system Cascade subunit CasB [Trueperella bonasi]